MSISVDESGMQLPVCFNAILCGCCFFGCLFFNCSFLCISLFKGRSEVFVDFKYLSGTLAVLACVGEASKSQFLVLKFIDCN